MEERVENGNDLGSQVRKHREKLCYTQEGLAEKLGMTSIYISLIECGKRVPKLETLIRMATILNTSLDSLAGRGMPGNPSNQMSVIMDKLKELPQVKQEKMIDMFVAMVDVEAEYDFGEKEKKRK